MKVTYQKIHIHKNAMTEIPKTVPAWHTPVYQERYGDGKIIIVDEKIVVETDQEPELEAEVGRLMSLGVDENTKQPFFVTAYGAGKAGQKALAEAIKEHTTATRANKKATPKAEPEKDNSAESDPLE